MAKNVAQKIIPTTAKRGHVEVDACLIWCIDPRFAKALSDLKKANSWKTVDELKYPGGGKALAEKGACREVILEGIAASVRLHNPKKIVPMFHIDCGAYKPLSLKCGQTEQQFLENEVIKAKQALNKFDLPVQPVIVDFDKIIVV